MPPTRDELVADLAASMQHAQDYHPLEGWPDTYDVELEQPTPYGILLAETALDRLALLVIEPLAKYL